MDYELLNWSKWKGIPSPENCRSIDSPEGPGVYQIRCVIGGNLIQFGISKNCRKRMKSLFPKPFGIGTRNNEHKRSYILNNWKNLEYRTLKTNTREEAQNIEKFIKSLNNHLFNT
jgi:peptidyl-tRNA hydrolase